MKSLLLIAVLAVSSIHFSYGQELSYGYYNYIMNPYNLNPAFAGNSGNITATLNTKTYMAGFNDAPRNTMFGIDAPITRKQGIGARAIFDKRGAFELSKYDATYSYQVKIDEVSNLRFGISAGAIRRMLNPNSIGNAELLNQADPTLSSGYFDEVNFIAGAGLLYQYKDFQFGFSAPHLVVGGEDLSNYLVGTASYRYAVGESDFVIEPTLIYQNLPVVDNHFDILLKGEYRETVWAQVGYQSTNNLNLALGFDFGAFGVGYSYGMNNNELSNISSNYNEIIIRISFMSPKLKKRNELVETLDEYVTKFNAMLQDDNGEYSKATVFGEIENMRVELSKLSKKNDKKTAKLIKDRLIVLENQIVELEKKYKK